MRDYQAAFPQTRLRRTRQAGWIRELAAETRLCPADLIYPCFVQEGAGERTPIAAMPGVARLSVDLLVEEAREAYQLGIPAIALFPVVPPEKKSTDAKEALNRDNLVCRAIRALKAAVPEIGIIGDVALDPYTSHGQDGIVEAGSVLNDATVEMLTQQALVLAGAGCDVVAPSDMMDGRIGAIRGALENEGYQDTLILSYAAKYASAFYGPFREAVGSAGALGAADKKTYQMDPANGEEALREAALDVAEGADMLMVKPGLPYLDVLARLRAAFALPILAYQVSGEYAMLRLAAEAGHIDYRASMLEALTCLKRAGASAILTYGAKDAAHWL